ncbi:hypothetical protein DASC09_000590 [Saccharomycopsis crataegensis]|uniref:Uncharacterized protein n=1 Tax=Saccharomycopsis crataegensis TaxID=43959 RepID=A0AAV5QDG1_9ASCO|nr:hypothetical protein DASC09_000590 [Saccharomycopsis crataegensis]
MDQIQLASSNGFASSSTSITSNSNSPLPYPRISRKKLSKLDFGVSDDLSSESSEPHSTPKVSNAPLANVEGDKGPTHPLKLSSSNDQNDFSAREVSRLPRSFDILSFEDELSKLLESANSLDQAQKNAIQAMLHSVFDFFQIPISFDKSDNNNNNKNEVSASLIDIASSQVFFKIQDVFFALSSLIQHLATARGKSSINLGMSSSPQVQNPASLHHFSGLKSPLIASDDESLDKLSPLNSSYTKRRPSNSSFGSPLRGRSKNPNSFGNLVSHSTGNVNFVNESKVQHLHESAISSTKPKGRSLSPRVPSSYDMVVEESEKSEESEFSDDDFIQQPTIGDHGNNSTSRLRSRVFGDSRHSSFNNRSVRNSSFLGQSNHNNSLLSAGNGSQTNNFASGSYSYKNNNEPFLLPDHASASFISSNNANDSKMSFRDQIQTSPTFGSQSLHNYHKPQNFGNRAATLNLSEFPNNVPGSRTSFPGFAYSNSHSHSMSRSHRPMSHQPQEDISYIEGFDEVLPSQLNSSSQPEKYDNLFIDMNRSFDYTKIAQSQLQNAVMGNSSRHGTFGTNQEQIDVQNSSFSGNNNSISSYSHHKQQQQQLKNIEALERLKSRATSRANSRTATFTSTTSNPMSVNSRSLNTSQSQHANPGYSNRHYKLPSSSSTEFPNSGASGSMVGNREHDSSFLAPNQQLYSHLRFANSNPAFNNHPDKSWNHNSSYRENFDNIYETSGSESLIGNSIGHLSSGRARPHSVLLTNIMGGGSKYGSRTSSFIEDDNFKGRHSFEDSAVADKRNSLRF